MKHAAGAEAQVDSAALAARLKSCPDTSSLFDGILPQNVKLALFFAGLAA
jgi:hypothetical protein